jgi:predicted permease
MKWFDAFRTRLRLVFRRRDAEARMRREFDLHIDMEAEHLVRAQGLTPDEARRQARVAFGGAEGHREALRDGRGLAWLGGFSLDLKLGLRMFLKYPGLSAVAVVGMAIAIAIGAGYFAFIGAMLDSSLPMHEGDRVVVIQNRLVAGSDAGDTTRASEHDFAQWRGALKSVEDLGAFREESYSVIAANRPPRQVQAAAITASGFRLTRVAPVLGRTLIDEDERPGALPVLVIGHDDWQRQFDGDPGVLGTTVRLDETVHTIVGVMPEGFAFPLSHAYWVALRLTDAAKNPGAEPSLHVFGRLARGFSEKQARSELATVGDQMAAAFPQTHGNIRPQVYSYTRAFIGFEGPDEELAVRSFQIGVGLLLLIVAVNVAIVVYARTVTRAGEIAVRTALGASRARITGQLFVEALVLSGTAAAIGLTIVSVLLAKAGDALNQGDEPLPYWIEFGVSPALILYVTVLAVLAGLIVGVIPALKATGKRTQARLQQFASRGASMQLGRTWTALIVLQVAMTMAALPAAMYHAIESLRIGMRPPVDTAGQLVRGTLGLSRDDAMGDSGLAARARVGDARFTGRMTTLLQKLEAEPEVAGVTYARQIPGAEWGASIEVDTDPSRHGAAAASEKVMIYTRTNAVAPNLFDVFGVRILAGRGFTPADALPPSGGVIVDQSFAERLGAGGAVVGRRIRYSTTGTDGRAEVSPWHEIIGIVPAFAETITPPSGLGPMRPRLYHAAVPGQIYPAAVFVRVRGADAAGFAPRLREITATVDPTLKLERVNTVLASWNNERTAYRLMAVGVIAGTLSVLLLSAAGIYAMMAFTVSRRRREIGIRAALGANACHVFMGIFGRTAAQLTAGIVAGLAVASGFEWLQPGGTMGDNAHIILPSVVGVMFAVGLLAAIGPARRGLAVQPTEALREE